MSKRTIPRLANDPAFSKSPFVVAQSLKIGVELMPLIFSRKVMVTEILLEQPQITLLKAPNGTWNFSSLGVPSTKKKTRSPRSASQGYRQTSQLARVSSARREQELGFPNTSFFPTLTMPSERTRLAETKNPALARDVGHADLRPTMIYQHAIGGMPSIIEIRG